MDPCKFDSRVFLIEIASYSHDSDQLHILRQRPAIEGGYMPLIQGHHEVNLSHLNITTNSQICFVCLANKEGLRNYLPRSYCTKEILCVAQFDSLFKESFVTRVFFTAEVGNVVQFGRSVKRSIDSKMIGQYGNGLKS